MRTRQWKAYACYVVALSFSALIPVIDVGRKLSSTISPAVFSVVEQTASVVKEENTNKKSSLPPETLTKWLSNQTKQQLSPPHTPVAFIHVGKTGGSTLTSLLANGCHSWIQKPCKVINNETLISRLSTYYHVPDFFNGRISKYNYQVYVISVRDPFSKFLSAFTYEHPANIQVAGGNHVRKRIREKRPFFQPCFPSIEYFAEALGDGDLYDFYYPFPVDTVNNSDCTALARATMNNRVMAFQHVYANTKYVVSLLPKNSLNSSTILVLRNENLWGDWRTANQWLGQQKDDVATFPSVRIRDYSTVVLPVSKNVSAVGQRRLCRALEPEYQVYLDLIRRASNLGASDKEQALQIARQHCPLLNLTLS